MVIVVGGGVVSCAFLLDGIESTPYSTVPSNTSGDDCGLVGEKVGTPIERADRRKERRRRSKKRRQ